MITSIKLLLHNARNLKHAAGPYIPICFLEKKVSSNNFNKLVYGPCFFFVILQVPLHYKSFIQKYIFTRLSKVNRRLFSCILWLTITFFSLSSGTLAVTTVPPRLQCATQVVVGNSKSVVYRTRSTISAYLAQSIFKFNKKKWG